MPDNKGQDNQGLNWPLIQVLSKYVMKSSVLSASSGALGVVVTVVAATVFSRWKVQPESIDQSLLKIRKNRGGGEINTKI